MGDKKYLKGVGSRHPERCVVAHFDGQLAGIEKHAGYWYNTLLGVSVWALLEIVS